MGRRDGGGKSWSVRRRNALSRRAVEGSGGIFWGRLILKIKKIKTEEGDNHDKKNDNSNEKAIVEEGFFIRRGLRGTWFGLKEFVGKKEKGKKKPESEDGKTEVKELVFSR